MVKDAKLFHENFCKKYGLYLDGQGERSWACPDDSGPNMSVSREPGPRTTLVTVAAIGEKNFVKKEKEKKNHLRAVVLDPVSPRPPPRPTALFPCGRAPRLPR